MKTPIFLFVAIVLAFAFRQPATGGEGDPRPEKGMIKVSVVYPQAEGKTFDWDYYLNKHVPLLKSTLGPSLLIISVDKGISGRTPDSPTPYVAMCHMYFKDMASFKSDFAPHSPALGKDVPNYTNIQPVVQVSEVVE